MGAGVVSDDDIAEGLRLGLQLLSVGSTATLRTRFLMARAHPLCAVSLYDHVDPRWEGSFARSRLPGVISFCAESQSSAAMSIKTTSF